MAGRVVVVGATGAIGSAIARGLAARGRELRPFGRDGARLAACLLSDDAGRITVQVFAAGGGRSTVRTKG